MKKLTDLCLLHTYLFFTILYNTFVQRIYIIWKHFSQSTMQTSLCGLDCVFAVVKFCFIDLFVFFFLIICSFHLIFSFLIIFVVVVVVVVVFFVFYLLTFYFLLQWFCFIFIINLLSLLLLPSF